MDRIACVLSPYFFACCEAAGKPKLSAYLKENQHLQFCTYHFRRDRIGIAFDIETADVPADVVLETDRQVDGTRLYVIFDSQDKYLSLFVLTAVSLPVVTSALSVVRDLYAEYRNLYNKKEEGLNAPDEKKYPAPIAHQTLTAVSGTIIDIQDGVKTGKTEHRLCVPEGGVLKIDKLEPHLISIWIPVEYKYVNPVTKEEAWRPRSFKLGIELHDGPFNAETLTAVFAEKIKTMFERLDLNNHEADSKV